METKEKDERYFGRGSKPVELEVLRTEGSYIYDHNGKRYLDLLGGAGVGNLGWKNFEIEEAIRNKDRPSYVYPNFFYKPWADLAEILEGITPGKLQKSFRATGGSEAVEAAIEIAGACTGRKKMLSIEGSYHGNTLGALSIGAISGHASFPNLLGGCEKIKPPLDVSALERVRDVLKSREIAGVIMEPVIINMGVLIPDTEFMKGLGRLCKEFGSLLIMDEAITGFGRTGKMFASEYYDINPDILCMAKGITAGHAGMGAVITTAEVAAVVEGKIGLYSSYGWHPLSVDVAIIAITYLITHKQAIFDNINKMSALFGEELPKLAFRSAPEIRIKGLAIGVDLHDSDYAALVRSRAMNAGLLMNTEGGSLLFLPNFLIDEDQVMESMEILKTCI